MELINNFINFYNNLDKKITSPRSLSFARRLVYVWIFINYAILATKASFFYAAESLIPNKDFAAFENFEKIFNILHHPLLERLYPLFLILILIGAALGFAEVKPRLISGITYFLMINLDNKAYAILDGGNNLMHLIAFYLIFVNTNSSSSPFSKTLTNLSHLMIKFQIVSVYATAGLLKVMGPLWNKGVALYYTMGVPEYGTPALFDLLSQFPILLALFTLGTVLFQISLPFLIWQRSWRPLIILVGTGLHFSISFVMGLFMFGMAMCVGYYFFNEDQEMSLS